MENIEDWNPSIPVIAMYKSFWVMGKKQRCSAHLVTINT